MPEGKKARATSRPPNPSRQLFKRAVAFTTLVVLAVCVTVEWWPHRESPRQPNDKLENLKESDAAPATLNIRAKQPEALQELLALSPEELEQVDIVVMNLLCAEGLRGAEKLDIQKLLDTLDEWSRHVSSETLRNFHRFAANPKEYGNSLAYYRMIMLATVLQQDFGAHYSPQRAVPQLRGKQESSDAFFADAKDVFLHGLLGGERQGTCSSLPVLYAAVAQRMGFPVSLASTKGHFYVRYEDGDEHLNVEATSIGFNSYRDEYYRRWPFPVSDGEARTYGLLRPLSKKEILGTFLAIRANCLTSMKRLDDAAATWALASQCLPETPALKRIVDHSLARAYNEKAADRWDVLWEEVDRLGIPAKPEYAHLKDQKVRLQLLMNQSTNLTVIEGVVAQFRQELALAWKREFPDADSAMVVLPSPPGTPSAQLISAPALELLAAATASLPARIQIPAERVPSEYQRGIPTELQERLRGLTVSLCG